MMQSFIIHVRRRYLLRVIARLSDYSLGNKITVDKYNSFLFRVFYRNNREQKIKDDLKILVYDKYIRYYIRPIACVGGKHFTKSDDNDRSQYVSLKKEGIAETKPFIVKCIEKQPSIILSFIAIIVTIVIVCCTKSAK